MKRVFTFFVLFLLFRFDPFAQGTLISDHCIIGNNNEMVQDYQRMDNEEKLFFLNSTSNTGNYIFEPVDSLHAYLYGNLWMVYVNADNSVRWGKNLAPVSNQDDFYPYAPEYFQFVHDLTGTAILGAVKVPDVLWGEKQMIRFEKFSDQGDTLVQPFLVDSLFNFQYNGEDRDIEKIVGSRVTDSTYLFYLSYKSNLSNSRVILIYVISDAGQLISKKEMYENTGDDVFFTKGDFFRFWYNLNASSYYLDKYNELGNVIGSLPMGGNENYATNSLYRRQLMNNGNILFYGYYNFESSNTDTIFSMLTLVNPDNLSKISRLHSFDTTNVERSYFTYLTGAGPAFNSRTNSLRSDYVSSYATKTYWGLEDTGHSRLIKLNEDLSFAWEKEVKYTVNNTSYGQASYSSYLTSEEPGSVIYYQLLHDAPYSNNKIRVLSRLDAANGDILWSNRFPDTVIVNNKIYLLTDEGVRFSNVRNGIQYYLVDYTLTTTPTFLMTAIFKLDIITGDFSLASSFFPAGNIFLKEKDLYLNDIGKFLLAGYTSNPSYCQDNSGYNVAILTLKTNYNTVKGKIYIDYNNNNVQDPVEPYYVNGFITYTKGSVTKNNFIYYNNQYQVITDTGKYIFKFLPVSTLYTVSPGSKTINHTNYNNTDVVNFALKPIGTVYDADVLLINSFRTRLGRQNSYVISCSNKGNFPLANTQLKLKLDGRLTVQSASEVYSINGDTLVWNISSFQPGDRKSITVEFMADIPPLLNSGDTLLSIASIYVAEGDIHLSDNTWFLPEIVQASYDPNDKTVDPENLDLSAIARNTPLTYTIRFENVGNDTAFTVIIKDTLPDNVDMNSLQPVASSHPYTLEVVNGKYLTFTFANIQLPYKAQDPEGAHGFVSYQVVPKSNFSGDNYEIKNTAHIYFDYNLPVTTNTATTFVQIVTAAHTNPSLEKYINIYPNPTQDKLVVDMIIPGNQKVQLKLFDVTGKLLQSQITTSTQTILDISKLPAGEFLLQVEMKEGIISKKVIVVR